MRPGMFESESHERVDWGAVWLAVLALALALVAGLVGVVWLLW